MENTYQMLGFIFGIAGIALAIGAYQKADKIERELKKKKILSEDFNGDK